MITRSMALLARANWETHEAAVAYSGVLSLVHKVLKHCRKKLAAGGDPNPLSSCERVFVRQLATGLPSILQGFLDSSKNPTPETAKVVLVPFLVALCNIVKSARILQDLVACGKLVVASVAKVSKAAVLSLRFLGLFQSGNR